jgi:hypothetical protein
MKTIDQALNEKLPEIVFVKDGSLVRFKGKNLFPDKVACAKEDFKNVVIPPR